MPPAGRPSRARFDHEERNADGRVQELHLSFEPAPECILNPEWDGVTRPKPELPPGFRCKARIRVRRTDGTDDRIYKDVGLDDTKVTIEREIVCPCRGRRGRIVAGKWVE